MTFPHRLSKGLQIRLIGSPVVSLLVCVILGGKGGLSSLETLTFGWGIAMLITFAVWTGNVEIMRWLHDQFPQPSQTFKRTLLLFLGCIVYSSIAYFLLNISVLYFLGMPFNWDNFQEGLQITLYVTLPITLLYESYFFYQNWEKASSDAERLKKENVQAQLESLRSQVNPHFLFNSLNTLVSIIPDCPETAMDFVHKLSYVYRYLLSVQERELVTLDTELDFIASYLFLLKVRFGESLQVEIAILEEDKDKKLPPISLQLLIENAIKHNIVSATKPLQLKIYSEGEYLIVQNNKQAKQSIEESTGIGLENIQKRYQILSDKTVKIIDNEDRFMVIVPLLSSSSVA